MKILTAILLTGRLICAQYIFAGYNAGGCSGQTQLDSDNFGGTAGTVLHTYNSKWDAASFSNSCGDAKIATGSNAATGGIESCDQRTGSTWTNDQYVQCTFLNVPTIRDACCVRMSATTSMVNGYCLGADPTDTNGFYRLWRVDAGVITTLHASSTLSVAANDVINLQIKGTAFTIKINGSTTAEFSVTDSTYTSGNPGLDIAENGTTAFIGSWSAGSVC